MVEHQMNRYRVPYFDQAIFQPSKLELKTMQELGFWQTKVSLNPWYIFYSLELLELN